MISRNITDRQKLERLKELRNKNVKSVEISEERKAEIDRNKCEWLTFWRRNINLYIEHKLGIHSYPFQQISYFLMADSTMYEEVATRGLSKTFRMPVYGFAECLLRPHTQVVFTAATFGQATLVLEDKIKKEIFPKDGVSSVISYLYENGYITVKPLEQKYEIQFFNGSTFTIVACLDSSRGIRSTILMFEECRLMKKGLIDSIFENTSKPRAAGYRRLPQYAGEEYLEETKTIYITSNRFKNEWFYKLLKTTFVGYFNSSLSRNRVFAGDIFLAIKYGLKTKKWYLSKKKTMNELDFRMEVLNEALGEVENCYYTLEQFQKNQVLRQAFIPPTIEQWINHSVKNREKRPDEIRLLFIDFAFANSNGRNENDNTVIGCLSAYPKGDGWVRNVDYLETHGGSDNDNTLIRIRELFWSYQADYIALDGRNGGETNFNALTKEFEHPQLPEKLWNKHGFTVSNEMDIHMATQAKIVDLMSRTVDPQAIPCIIPIYGVTEFNSNMYQDLSQKLKNEEIKFLIDDLDYQQIMDNDKKYVNMTSEERTRLRVPYLQTLFLINEAVNLTAEWKAGMLHLTEARNAYKDRIVALAYGNAIMSKIINKKEKLNNQDDLDLENVQLVF